MPRLQSGESRQKAKCREAGAESWELEVGSGELGVDFGGENLNSKFSLLSSNFSKTAFGKMPQAGMG